MLYFSLAQYDLFRPQGFWAVTAVELVSPYSPSECEERLRAAIDPDDMLSPIGSRPVVGRVSNGSVRLRKRIGYRNSFQTVLTGTLEAFNGVTLFRGQAGMHWLVSGLMVVWFGLLILISGAILLVLRQHLIDLIGPLLMLVFGVGLVWLGRWLARSEQAFLIAFVAERIAARRVPEHESGGGEPGGELGRK